MSKFVLTAQLQLQAPKNVRKVVSQIQSQLKNVQVNVTAKNATQTNKQIQSLSKSANQASNSFDRMGKSLGASVRRFTALAIATRAVSLFTNTLGASIKEAIAFERELVKISQVTGKTVSQLNGLANSITKLSTGLGVSSTSLLGVSRILAQTGLSARDTQTALATLARTELAPTFDNITSTAEGAVAILNQFGQGAAALEAQLGSLNAVAGQFAVESGDLISVIRRTGGVFKSAGGDLNELIALFTSVRATTRESAESIATGLRTIFTRIQRPKTIEFLRQYGVELVDLEGKFIGPFEAVRQLSQALAGLEEGDITFVEIAEQLGGFRQIGKVIPLLQQFSVAQAALNVAQEGSGSLATDAAKAQAALAVQITKVKEEFAALIRSITSSTSFQIMADTVLKLTSALIKLADALSPILPLITAFAGIKMIGALGGGAGKMFGMNSGGKVMKFARGGSVPGTGNRDTVPAMLQPGEFVIKKSSVAKLGVDTLHRMNNNRFEDGGVQNKLKSKQGMGARFAIDKQDINATLKASGDKSVGDSDLDIGAAFLQPEGILKSVRASLTGAATAKLIDPVRKGLGSVTKEEVKELTKLSKAMSIDIQAGALNKSTAESFQAQLKKSISDFSSRFASTNLKGRPAFNKSKFSSAYNLANVAQVEGNIFEAFIGGLSDKPFNEERIAANATFDYPQGLGAAGSVFGIDPSRIADAKRSFNEDALSSLAKKGTNRIVEGFRSTVAQKLIAEGRAGFAGDKKARTKAAAAAPLKGYASGGPAGPDTVPALLTPGEFVVNRKSAQQIGYSRLGKMNKIGRFNKGGPVGDIVQRFESGGGVASINTAQASKSLLGLARVVNSVTSSFANQLTVSGQMSAATNQRIQGTLQANNASIKSAAAKIREAQASQKAAAADEKEAAESQKAAVSDKAEADSGSGLLLAFGALTTGISMLIPTIDENSSAGTRFAAKLGDLALQLTTLAFLVSQVNFSKMASSIGGAIENFKKLGGASKALSAAQTGLSKKSLASLQGAVSANPAASAGGSGIGKTMTALSSLANPLTLFLAAIAATIAVVYLWSSSVADAAEAAKKKAIEDGNAAEAVKQAQVQAGGERGKGTAKGMAAGALTGAALGAFLGPVGMAVGAALGMVIGSFFGDFFVAFDKTAEVLTKTAEAAALQNAAQKALAESGKAATDAMKKFRDGNATASEALAATSAGTTAVLASQKATIAANTALMKNTRTAASAVGDFLVGLTGFSFGFGTTKQNEDKAQAKIDEQNKEQDRLSKEAVSQNQPAINALGKQVAVAGGDFASFFAKLQAANPALAELANQDDLRKAFENIQKEVDRAKAAFAAMNLGFQGVNAAASAAALSVENLVGGFDGSVSEIDRTIATLKAGVTNAAQGLDDGVFESAVSSASKQIERLGGDAGKFRENMQAINQAQKFFANASAEAKNNLQAEFARGAGGSGDAQQRRSALGNAIVGQMDGVGDDVKQRILDAVEGADIKQEDLDKILAGDMDVLDKVLSDLGETTLSQVLPALENLAKVEKQLADVQTRRLALEDKFISSIQRQIDVTLEAADIMAEFGGAAVTPEQRSQGIVSQLNASGSALGLSEMRTGSADEIRQRNREIAEQQAAMQRVREQAAAGDSDAQTEINSPEFKARQERLNKAAEENYQKTKQLIDVKRKEIKVIEAKNAAEKKATEALLGNNIEEFLDQMAGKGAATAAALGSPQLAAQFGMSAFGTANKQLEEMQKSGVSSFMGRDIASVRQNAVGFGLTGAGMGFGQAAGLAQAATGTSPEALAAKSAARDLASTLPGSTANLMQSSQNMLEATKILESEVEKEVSNAVNNVQTRSAGAGGVGGAPPAGAGGAPPAGAGAGAGTGASRDNEQKLAENTQASNGLQASTNKLSEEMAALSASLGTSLPDFAGLENAAGLLNTFQQNFNATVDKLAGTTISVSVAPTTVNVNLNGGEFLSAVSKSIRADVMREVTAKLGSLKILPDGSIGVGNTAGPSTS